MKTRKTRAAGLIAAMLFGLTFMARPAGAVQGNPVDLTVTVTIQQLDITATFRGNGTATYGLGTVSAGNEYLVTDPITVTNSGNLTETYNLRITAEPNNTWASVAGSNPGAEQYQMAGLFRAPADGAAITGDYVDGEDDYSVGTVRTADGANVVAKNADAGGVGTKGFTMASASNVYLWLKFHAPSSTVITTQQSIVTRITAATP